MKIISRLLPVAVAAAALLAPAAASADIYNVAIGTYSTAWTNVFDVSGGSTAAGAKVIQYVVTGGANQRWNFVDPASGYYHVVNAKTGYCLTSNGLTGSQLYVTYCNADNPRQRWMLPPQLDAHTTGAPLIFPAHGTVTDPFQYSTADVQNNSWQPGAAIVTGAPTWSPGGEAARLAYWYWG